MFERHLTNFQAPGQPAWLSTFVSGFIYDQRDRFIGGCKPLRAQHLERMAQYFPVADLERVRYRNIFPDRLANPAFFAGLQAVGFNSLPDFGRRKAATFDHVIVTREPFTPAMLFHELVHVVQYRLLGVEGFAASYVQALLTGDAYGSTPLEACAQALEDRFSSGTGPIDVEREIKHWIAANKTSGQARPSIEKRSWRTAFVGKWRAIAGFGSATLRSTRTQGVQ